MSSPLHQFEVKPIISLEWNGVNLSFTNASLFMALSAFLGICIMWLLVRKQKLVPSTAQSIGEYAFGFIKNIAKDGIGEGYDKFIPFIFCTFLMIFFGNFLGLFPYSFTFTSQLAPVGAFALLGLLINIIAGIKKQGLSWFRTFLPSGIPVFMAPIIVPIEMFSMVVKPFSLTVRLVMNMIVGHILLKTMAGFVYSLGLGGVVPLLVVGMLMLFEMFIAFLQAYVFTLLTSLYIGQAIHSH